jgi:hypothetical protein
MMSDLLAEADPDRLIVEVQPAQVPFMITQAQRQRLREIGHDEKAIREMTPEVAHRLLGVPPPLSR